MKIRKIYFIVLSVLVYIGVSCNDDISGGSEVTLPANVMVRSFSLAKNDSVLSYLDSVYFTIDLEKAVIFNANPLPKGTDISALIANITFSDPSSVKIYVDKGDVTKNDTIDYLAAPADSIDFTGKVTMEVIAANTTSKRRYDIKVNVSDLVADSLQWGDMAYAQLPGTSGIVSEQKTVRFKGDIYCFTHSGAGYQLAKTNSIPGGWNTGSINFAGFTPDIHSLQTTENALYLLSTSGELYTSLDGTTWNNTGASFYSLIAGWENRVLGIVKDGTSYKHDEYPRPTGYVSESIDPTYFPVSGFSNPVSYTAEWMTSSQTIFVGGRLESGVLTNAVWGYDGNINENGTGWAILNNVGSFENSVITPREGATFFPYYTFSINDKNGNVTQNLTWFIIGGKDNNGYLKDVYVSRQPGVDWNKAESLLTLPAGVEARAFASVLVEDELVGGPSMTNWKKIELPAVRVGMKMRSRIISSTNYTIPYIYVFGGESAANNQYNQIWRAVINRLTFEPIP